jgi:hypothetical protein
MSSTNRKVRRAIADDYPTPDWCVRQLLREVPLPGGHWLEPTAGTGNIIRAVNNARQDVTWDAIELRPECKDALDEIPVISSVVIGDFLNITSEAYDRPFSAIITNPPYSYAMPIIEHALKFNTDLVIMLLRLNFIATGTRAEFMRSNTPDIFVLPNRPSFSGHGTDSIEYAWFVWDKNNPKTHGRIEVLPVLSSNKRKI